MKIKEPNAKKMKTVNPGKEAKKPKKRNKEKRRKTERKAKK